MCAVGCWSLGSFALKSSSAFLLRGTEGQYFSQHRLQAYGLKGSAPICRVRGLTSMYSGNLSYPKLKC